MRCLSICFGVALSLVSNFVLAQTEEGTHVQIHLLSPSSIGAGPTTVRFQLIDTQTQKQIGAADLKTDDEALIHFIAYDSGLKEFQHVHPTFDGSTWSVDMNFPVNGDYFIWAQGVLTIGSADFSAPTHITIAGGQPAWPPPLLTDNRSCADRGSIATLSSDPIQAGVMTMLMVAITRIDGSSPVITPYLGMFAHFIATPQSGQSIFHDHAMQEDSSNMGMAQVMYPTAGAYRVWVQFVDGGVIKTVPLSIIVVP